MQYRDKEIQTSQPVLQDQTLALVDIPPPMHDPVGISPPMPDPVPVGEIAEPHTDIPSMTEEPVEIGEPFTVSPPQPEISPTVLENLLELPSGLDQELSVDLTESPEEDTVLMSCLADVSNRPQSTPAESDGPEVEPEDEPTGECVTLCPDLPEIPTKSRSLIHLPCRDDTL